MDEVSRAAQIGRQRGAHQVDEVVGIEALHRLRAASGQGFVKALERRTATFDMRVVGGEHRHLRAGLGDDPAGVLMRIGRDAQLALGDLAGPG